MVDTFDFQEALSCIKADMPVCLNIDGKERKYFLNDKGEIMCTPNGKEYLTYKVQKFHIDAVMSREWKLCN